MTHASIWSGDSAPLAAPALTEDCRSDVVIVGGGITGITTALRLAAAGRQVLVLEAARIGDGTTGSSTGNLYVPVGHSLHELHKGWGDRLAPVLQARAAALRAIEYAVQEYALDCSWQRVPWTLYAPLGDEEGDAMLEREAAALRDLGWEPQQVERPSLPFAAGRALVLADQAQIHPLRYVRGLAQAAQRLGVRIAENCPVLQADEDTGEVRTAQAVVKADALIWATHTPKGRHVVHTEMGPYREYAVAAPLPDPHSLPFGIFWSAEEDRISIRRFDRDGVPHVLMLGADHKTGQQADTDEPYRTLESRCRDRFGIAHFPFRWSAQHYRPADGLPYIGPSLTGKRSWFATGFSADGLVYGTVAADILSAQVQGREHTAAAVFAPSRFTPVMSAANFVMENLNVAGRLVKDYVESAPPETLAGIERGDGCVVQCEGERLAVHRDPAGRLHAVSAICPHMKCVVHWNKTETTWDCPCHGSRFTAQGAVIEGPALRPLEPRPLPDGAY